MKVDVKALENTPRNHNSFINGYLEYTQFMEAPKEFHMWTALSIISGALRAKCFIDMGYFKWKPNQFIVFVAPPGVVSKSTTSGVGTDLLREVPGVNFGPNSVTWQKMLEKFRDVEETVKIGNKSYKQSCLTFDVSELGTFLDFNNRDMVDAIVDIWDAKDKPFERSTMGGGDSYVQAPWMNMIGCTTPSWIQESMPKYAIGGGFTSRTIFVYADKKQKLIAYPADHVPAHQGVRRKKLIEDLTRISLLKGEFKLDEEAKKFGEEWYRLHHEKPDEHLQSDLLGGYRARKQTHMHKIAMCLSAAQSDDKIITKKHLETALSLLRHTELNMPNVFNSISDDKDAANLQILKEIIKRFPNGVRKDELMYRLETRMGYETFRRSLDMGIASKLFTLTVTSGGDKIKPTAQLLKQGMFQLSNEDEERLKRL